MIGLYNNNFGIENVTSVFMMQVFLDDIDDFIFMLIWFVLCKFNVITTNKLPVKSHALVIAGF